MKEKRLPFILSLGMIFAGTHVYADWVYANGYMTNGEGWKIQIGSVSGTSLSTVDNAGMVKAWPATPDRADGTYTLDLSGTITDAADPSKTYQLTTIGYYAFNGGVDIGSQSFLLLDTSFTWSQANYRL